MAFLASEACRLKWVVMKAENTQMAIATAMAFAGCEIDHTSGQYAGSDHSLGAHDDGASNEGGHSDSKIVG